MPGPDFNDIMTWMRWAHGTAPGMDRPGEAHIEPHRVDAAAAGEEACAGGVASVLVEPLGGV